MSILYKYYGLFEDFMLKPNFKIHSGLQTKNHGSFEKYKKRKKLIYRLGLSINRSPKLIIWCVGPNNQRPSRS
jgi:hypothetical protein